MSLEIRGMGPLLWEAERYHPAPLSRCTRWPVGAFIARGVPLLFGQGAAAIISTSAEA